MITKELKQLIETAETNAYAKKHEFLMIEHLLLQLLSYHWTERYLRFNQINIEEIRNNVENYLNEVAPITTEDKKPIPSNAFNRVIRHAQEYAGAYRRDADCLDALHAIHYEPDSYASLFLNQAGATREHFKRFMEIFRQGIVFYQKDPKNIDKMPNYTDPEEQELALKVQKHFIELYQKNNPQKIEVRIERVKKEDDKKNEAPNKKEENKEETVAHLTQDLTQMAKNGLIDPLIGRENEMKRLIQILYRRRKSNPIIVGTSGVGKTALVEGLARAIALKDSIVPAEMHNYTILRLETGTLMAGTKYRGDLEERVKKIIKEIANKRHILLFIDEIHTVIGTGASGDGQIDIAALLKPAINQGEIRIIGVSSDKEFRQIIEKQPAFSHRFQRIDLHEPNRNQAIEIIKGLKKYYEQFHQVSYSEEAISATVDLSQRYLNDKALPDKAIDLLDEAGAIAKLNNKVIIDQPEIETLVAQQARIPSKNIQQNDIQALQNLEEQLQQVVYGQNEAIQSLVSALKLSRAGLRAQEKTIGNFLFTGPTGVGKTELCKQLSQILNLKLLRFDMSEYMEAHSISKLIGTAPGYVGYEQEGLLAKQILNYPYAILLLDEIEKAHADILNILLQIMDNGIFTDQTGREINCRNILVVLTSNVGAFELEKNQIGFIQSSNKNDNIEKEIKKHFPPEFRNRLDKIIHFSPLNENNILSVVDKFLTELSEMLKEKSIELSVDESCRNWLAKKGYDPKMGARPMARVIERHIKEELADLLLFEQLNQATINISIENDKPSLTVLKKETLTT